MEYIYPIDWSLGDQLKEKCPECGKEEMYLFSTTSGPDDYIKEWHCRNCGFWEQE